MPDAPAAAEPDVPLLDCAELPPDAELGELLEDEPLGGHWQFRLGELLLPPLADWLPLDEPALPLEEGEVAAAALPDDGDVAPLLDGELEPLVEGDVPPEAVVPELGEVEPDALPEPEDWLVCAPCVIVEDGLVVVAFWSAVAEPVDTLWSPVPRFTPAPTLAPALTSVLLMPTFASTPTFGFTFTPPEGDVLLVLSVDGELVLPDALPEPDDWLVCALWSVEDDCAKAEPKTLITAAAVILTATWRTLMITPFGLGVTALSPASAVPRECG